MDENLMMETTEQEAPVTPAASVRTIRFGDEEIVVKSFEPYIYNYGKGIQVLQLKIHEDDITMEQLEMLKAKPECISYYRDGVLKDKRDGYTAGCNYSYDDQTGIYFIELRFMGEFEHKVEQVAAALDFLAIMAGVSL